MNNSQRSEATNKNHRSTKKTGNQKVGDTTSTQSDVQGNQNAGNSSQPQSTFFPYQPPKHMSPKQLEDFLEDCQIEDLAYAQGVQDQPSSFKMGQSREEVAKWYDCSDATLKGLIALLKKH